MLLIRFILIYIYLFIYLFIYIFQFDFLFSSNFYIVQIYIAIPDATELTGSQNEASLLLENSRLTTDGKVVTRGTLLRSSPLHLRRFIISEKLK